MIQVEQIPFNDVDEKTIREWINHPGRILYQKHLAALTAGLMVEAENIRINDEYLPTDENSAKSDADDVSLKAKVVRAANKHLDEAVDRDYKFYTVEMKSEPTVAAV